MAAIVSSLQLPDTIDAARDLSVYGRYNDACQYYARKGKSESNALGLMER